MSHLLVTKDMYFYLLMNKDFIIIIIIIIIISKRYSFSVIFKVKS